ncbi:MAG: GyrI-like domain-containing protein [Hyphomonadaceae bacterium]
MTDIRLETVPPQLIAAVRSRVEIKDIMHAWEPALLQVKTFLAGRPDLGGDKGRQVFLYHHPTHRDQAMEIDFGIEVTAAFENQGAVLCASTPAGRVATAEHVGPLTTLPLTHRGIHEWCAANGHGIGGFSWETYEWGNGADPLRTIVRYALR